MANKKWTVMVYMAGDNNLQEEMVFALKSMTTVGSTDNVQVVAWSDSVGLAVPYIIPKRDQTKVKRLRDRIIPSGQNQQNQEPPSLAEFRLSLTETHHLKRQQEEFIKEKNDFSAYQTSREVDETRRELIDGLKVSIEHLEETNPNAPDLKELRNELKKLESNTSIVTDHPSTVWATKITHSSQYQTLPRSFPWPRFLPNSSLALSINTRPIAML